MASSFPKHFLKVGDAVASDGTIARATLLTQAAYDALTPDDATLYVVVDPAPAVYMGAVQIV